MITVVADSATTATTQKIGGHYSGLYMAATATTVTYYGRIIVFTPHVAWQYVHHFSCWAPQLSHCATVTHFRLPSLAGGKVLTLANELIISNN